MAPSGPDTSWLAKQLHYLWEYKWSSLPGYVDEERELDFIEYTAVLAEYGKNSQEAKAQYKKQIIDDLQTGLAIGEQIVARAFWVLNLLSPGYEELISTGKRTVRDRILERFTTICPWKQ